MTKTVDQCIARLLALHLEGINGREIASVLNAEGFATLRGKSFTLFVVNKLLHAYRHDIPSRYTIAFRRANEAAA